VALGLGDGARLLETALNEERLWVRELDVQLGFVVESREFTLEDICGFGLADIKVWRKGGAAGRAGDFVECTEEFAFACGVDEAAEECH